MTTRNLLLYLHDYCYHTWAACIWMCLCLFALPAYSAEAQLTVFTELSDIERQAAEPNTPKHVEDHASELTRAVLKEAGYKADISMVPWPRLVHTLETQANVLGYSMTRTPDREDLYYWIGLIKPVSFKLWGLRERADELPHTLEGARKLNIGVIRDDVVTNYLLSNQFDQLVYLSEHSNTLNMLRRGRIDLMPYIESGMEDYLSRQSQPTNTLAPIISLDEVSTGHYLVMSKNSDPELVQLLQDSYQSLEEQGELEKLRIRFLGN